MSVFGGQNRTTVPISAMSASTVTMNTRLRSWPREDETRASLSFLISQLNQQKGSFRGFTEQRLEEEAKAETTGKLIPKDDAVDSSEDEVDEKPPRERLMSAKADILKQVVQAQLDTAYALDFVSLLLTRHNSKQAESTISLFLKQNVPFGSIGAEVVQQTQQSASTQQTDLLVSNGWKLESLNSSADALLKSAARLEDEVRKETTYWGQVLAIEEKKWPISRLPREKHTLAVRYGFQEAAPEFRERGVAVLRRAADGSIDLDLGGGTAERAMRVLVVDLDSRVLSSSSDTITMGNDSVDIAILRARTSLFDEELFSEVFKESRLLANRGVVCQNDSISIPVDHTKLLKIVLEGKDQSNEYQDGSTSNLESSEQKLADRALLALRLLMSHMHKQNYNRRTAIPRPLTEDRPRRPGSTILRTILGHFEHQSVLNSLTSSLIALSKTLAKASLQFDFTTNSGRSFISDALKSLTEPESSKVPERILALLTQPNHSTITLTLANSSSPSSSKCIITARTHNLGTDYRIISQLDTTYAPHRNIPSEIIKYTLAEVEEHVNLLLTMDIVRLIENDPATKDIWIATIASGGVLESEPEVDGSVCTLCVGITKEKLLVSIKKEVALDQGREIMLTWMAGAGDESPIPGAFIQELKKLKGAMDKIDDEDGEDKVNEHLEMDVALEDMDMMMEG